MKVKQPSYYPSFRCSAGSCRDSCCIGWEISLDSETANRYRGVEGPLGERLRQAMQVTEENETLFQLGPGQRCPFLNSDGLCDLICQLGEDSLGEICREHPRFHQWYPGFREDGLGLCCEEAARLLLSQEKPLEFILTEEPDPEGEGEPLEFSPERARLLWEARSTGLRILQNRRHPVWERLAMLLRFGRMLEGFLPVVESEAGQDCAKLYAEAERLVREYASPDRQDGLLEMAGQIVSDSDLQDRQRMIGRILTFFSTLEPNRPVWLERLEGLRSKQALLAGSWEEIRREGSGTVYEQLAVYFFDRYFLDSCWYWDDPMGAVAFCALSVLLLSLLDAGTKLKKGAVSLEDRIESAKSYSREIEYSLENREQLGEWLAENEELQPERLIRMLTAGEQGRRFS